MQAFRKLFLPAALLLLLAAAITFALTRVQAAQTNATYAHGNLSVTLPFHATRAGTGKLIVEILDPEDHILGHITRNLEVAQGDGTWQQTITPDKPIAFEDIIWQRVHYRFTYSGNDDDSIEGTESISEILRRPVVHVLGQTEYLAGSDAALRVIVSDANNNDTALSGTMRIQLIASDASTNPTHNLQPVTLFSGRLNKRGTLEAHLHFPAALTGSYALRFVAETPIGSTEYTQPITLADKASILLTTEKPIYQPGQTIHVRALALDRADHKAEASRPLTFELEDSRGNKVFKRITETDKFGIASAEFQLANEVNLGTYHLRALMGSAEAPTNTQELALNVERYVLPKFKVAVDFTTSDGKPNGKPKRDFRPGDHVTGTVRAIYFFGKPVDHAEIKIKASSADVEIVEAASASGKTNDEGEYKFDLKLPAYFAGKPLSQGAARALVEATVTDNAAHAETRGEPITISQSSLLVIAIPEGGTLIPHLDNQVFLLTSYPDGTPAATTTVTVNSQHLTTDAGGIAVLHLTPASSLHSLHVDADDHHGNRLSTNVPLELREGAEQVLLRTANAVVKAGDPIHLKVLSTKSRGTAYVDIVKNGQTILTRDLDLTNGEASLTLSATPDMAGTLDISAYLFGRDAQPVADHRLLFVQPADELHIATTADAPSYKPGAEARIQFHVTNAHGEGVAAALGLQVVDEAVFALAEKQPGFAKVFFFLEQEAMKPRYEIHSLSVEEAVSRDDAQHDLAARALFSATELTSTKKLDTEFGRSLPQDRYESFATRYLAAYTKQVNRVAKTLSAKLDHRSGTDDVPRLFETIARDTNTRDAWGSPLHIERVSWWGSGRTRYFLVRSAGPNHHFDDADDLTVYLEERSKAEAQPTQRGGNGEVKIEHDRGPFNNHADFTGTITDATGAVIPGAVITLRQPPSSSTHIARTSQTGQFTLSALTPGRYTVEVAAQGFMTFATDFNVQPRDRANLSAKLNVGAVTETIAVSNEGLAVRDKFAVRRRVFEERALGAVGGPIHVPMMMPAPMAAAKSAVIDAQAVADLPINNRSSTTLLKAEPAAPHVRSYFPEALYINPEILTDAHGNASITIPIADSITTWRMAMLASTQNGALGTATSSLKVFQDFFVDLDLPVTLTQGDRVSLPVAIYNYTGARGNVSLALQPADWYSLSNDEPSKQVTTEPNRVGGSQFTLNANRIGKFKLTLTANMDGHADIVVREIEVVPNGKQQDQIFNGRLENSIDHTLRFPANALPDATSILVRLYPGPLSQVIEGMDSILQMPGGCFEQTSSSTYPNVLALDYMKRTKKLSPETHAKAEGYIANGYQRLLTFEVPGGGFSWFGQAPANKILTSYGLMEFNDMSKVSDVDPRLISRTRDWLISQQQPDGSWKPDTQFINEGATNRYNTNILRITAYIAWSLANTGYTGPAVEKAKQYIQQHRDKPDAYTLAIIANFAADFSKDKDFTRQAMQALIDARTEKDDKVFWSADETAVYSTGLSAAIETTGLATQALLKWGQANEVARKALAFIASKKDATGAWGTTQATITSLRALLLATQLSTTNTRGTVQVTLNGKPVETLKLTSDNNDLLHQFVFKNIDTQQANNVQLKFEGTGGLAYQVVGRYFTPWETKPAQEALSIDVAYDRTRLAQNDIVTATATVRNNLPKTANMVMVDLGIPPGFDLLTEDLQSTVEKTASSKTARLEKFSLTATQAILYVNALAPNSTTQVHFRLRAKYPIRARNFASRVYEYYDPAITATAAPSQFEVTAK